MLPSLFPHSRSRFVLQRLGRLVALMTLSVWLGTGCAPTVHYQPKVSLVQEMGLKDVQRRLRDVLLHATFPKVTSVSFAEETVKIKSQQSHLGMFYQTVTQQLENDLYLSQLERVEIYKNNYVFIYGSGKLQMKILFPSREEAQTFVDLLWSLRSAQTP
jgi:hypothetical protein